MARSYKRDRFGRFSGLGGLSKSSRVAALKDPKVGKAVVKSERTDRKITGLSRKASALKQQKARLEKQRDSLPASSSNSSKKLAKQGAKVADSRGKVAAAESKLAASRSKTDAMLANYEQKYGKAAADKLRSKRK